MGVAQANQMWLHLMIILFSFSISISSISGAESNCIYTAYVRTGPFVEDATDSKIILTLYDASGSGIRINNLVAWGGLMGNGYNYFERDSRDMFSGKGPCLSGPICKMVLTSDGTGRNHEWYCNYVEVTSTGDHKQCSQQLFNVDQWLSTNRSPYQLSATRNNCRRLSDEEQSLYLTESNNVVDV
ncbi:PLAT domain-containing protein 3 [Solanum lycopersicum]|uniref:PLAT domain-containing protein 3 n=1 Tax=Solanum lycopersicum TaxID=4081 RepID=UPI003748D281